MQGGKSNSLLFQKNLLYEDITGRIISCATEVPTIFDPIKRRVRFMVYDLVIQVVEIKGNCPVYKIGDTFYLINGFKLIAKKPLCMHSLSSLMPYYVALSQGILPTKLGLAQEDKAAYVQCLDPCKYTSGGTVVFEISNR